MQDLIKQEQFELEVLDKLNAKKFLDYLIFCGGTMLRLCFGLDRFSVDLDFWLRGIEADSLFLKVKKYLEENYTLKDAANKFYTLLFELKSREYPRSLKIEIRKSKEFIKTEPAIAYSPYSNRQLLLRVVSLDEMMQAKITAFLERKEIRDVFDIEFLLKRGIKLDVSDNILRRLLVNVDKLDKKDYTVKLGSLLEENKRRYYIQENFKILRLAIKEKLSIDH